MESRHMRDLVSAVNPIRLSFSPSVISSFTKCTHKKCAIIFIAVWFGTSDNNSKIPNADVYKTTTPDEYIRFKPTNWQHHIEGKVRRYETKLIEFHFIISIIQMECNQSYLCDISKLEIIEPTA